MKFQQSTILNKVGLCLILIFIGLMSASVTHAETYTFVTKWGSVGGGEGEFFWPSGIALDSSGNVYVADEIPRVQKFDSSGTYITQWDCAWPTDVDVDSSGNVYVSSEDRIQKFDNSGTLIMEWGSLGSGEGQFTCPGGVAVDSSDNVYVADSVNSRIQKFDSSGTFITQWGCAWPSGIDIDSSGNVYVSAGDRIQKFDSSGTFITEWGSLGEDDGQFGNAFGVAVDSYGNVYVVDRDNHRIQKFDSSGTFITKWGSLGSDDGYFWYPSDVAVDFSGNVYVSDYENNRIQKFALEKTTPTITWNNPEDIIYGTPLSSTQLNAEASVPGTFTYTADGSSIDLGTLLNVGKHILHVDFTPEDTANYNSASKNVEINVLTPEQKIQQIIATLQDMVTSGELNQGRANALISKLEAVVKKLNSENTEAATNELNAFVNQVNAFIQSGILSPTQGQQLIDEANSVINAIK